MPEEGTAGAVAGVGAGAGALDLRLEGEWAERAFVELNESREVAVEAVHELKLRIADEPDLEACMDDAFLLRFLRARKYDVTKAFTMLQRYYRMKQESPELFRLPRPTDRLHLLEMEAQCVLERRDHNGCRIYVFRVEKCDASRVSVEDVFSTNVLALESVVREPITQVAGVSVVVDMAGFSLQRHARFLGPYYARRTVEVIQETFPLRFKGFHVINQPFYFDAVFACLKPFLKDKMRQRVYLHGKDLGSLHSYVDRAILPAEYGGEQGPWTNAAWRESMLQLEDEFMDLERYGYKGAGPQLPKEPEIDLC